MGSITATANEFFAACETGKGWEVCKAYCAPNATFAAQAEPLANIKTLAEYADWMKGLMTIMPDGSYEVKSFATDTERNNVAAYAVFSGLNTYTDAGCLNVYAGTSAANARTVVQLIVQEFARLKSELLTPEELRRTKDYLKGSTLLGLESTMSRMANLARQEIYFGQFFTAEEIAARIDAVEAAQVQAMAQRLFDPDRIAVTLLGRLDGIKLNRTRLAC